MIFIKYKLRSEDIVRRQLHKTTNAGNQRKLSAKPNAAKKTQSKKELKPDQRPSVAPKYLNPNGREKWSGRDRTPS